MKKGRLIKLIAIVIILIAMIVSLTGCSLESSAETVNYNLSKEADEFHVRRRITFINLRTNEYLFEMVGNCSVQGGVNESTRELAIICRIGERQYQKHLLYIASETTYVVEQLEYNDVSRYDYEFIFRPEAIIPVEIKTQIGEE